MIDGTVGTDLATALGGVSGHLRFLNMQNLCTGGGDDIIDGPTAGVDGYRVFANFGNDVISMAGDIFAAFSRPDGQKDKLVLQDGFGKDTIRGFAFGGELDGDGNPAPADVLDVRDLHGAEGNIVDLNDVIVRGDVDKYGNSYAVISFPSREELWLHGVDAESLTGKELKGVGMPCFCAGTLIRTPHGDVAVKDRTSAIWS